MTIAEKSLNDEIRRFTREHESYVQGIIQLQYTSEILEEDVCTKRIAQSNERDDQTRARKKGEKKDQTKVMKTLKKKMGINGKPISKRSAI